MKKKILATTLTASIATALVATNGVISTFAFSGNDAQKVEVTSKKAEVTLKKAEVTLKKAKVIDNELKKTVKHQEVDPSITNLVEITDLSDYSYQKKSNQDMNNLEAVKLAKKAIEEKFKVSLDGTYSKTVFCTRVDMEGTFYSVDFEKITAGNLGLLSKGNEFYMSFVNSKTGEVVDIKKDIVKP